MQLDGSGQSKGRPCRRRGAEQSVRLPGSPHWTWALKGALDLKVQSPTPSPTTFCTVGLGWVVGGDEEEPEAGRGSARAAVDGL